MDAALDAYPYPSQIAQRPRLLDADRDTSAWPFQQHALRKIFGQRFQQTVAAWLEPDRHLRSNFCTRKPERIRRGQVHIENERPQRFPLPFIHTDQGMQLDTCIALRMHVHTGRFQTTSARKILAAVTILASAGITSFHWRVFRPQSGLTHNRSAGTRSAAFFISPTMCS